MPMNTRRFSMLASLLLTAALLYALPALMSEQSEAARTESRLLPPKTRTVTVWLTSDSVNDGRLINELCAAFEKEREGVRVFLRRVDAGELNDPKGVPPDIALYSVGDMRDPAQKTMKLEVSRDMSASLAGAGMSAGEQYGLPLWYDAPVLTFPLSWLESDAAPAPRSNALFELQTPSPTAEAAPFLSKAALPWRNIIAADALSRPQGVEWQQLLSLCPPAARGELQAALKAERAEAAKASIEAYSRVQSADDATICVCPLTPAASHRIRLMSIMREGAEARDFAQWLLDYGAQEAALTRGLMPAIIPAEIADPKLAALAALYGSGAIYPNAFEHTRQELYTICEDAFFRSEDAALTLIRLR